MASPSLPCAKTAERSSILLLDQRLVLAFIVLLIVATLSFLALSFIPYSHVRQQLTAFGVVSTGQFFNEGFYASLQMRLRLLALAALSFAGVLYILPESIARAIYGLRAYTLSGCRSLRARTFHPLHGALQRFATWEAAGVILIALFAAANRLLFLQRPMHYDEAYTYVYLASRSPLFFLTYYPAPNNHLFHTFVVYFSTSIFGASPWAIRMPALLAGIALVPLTYFWLRLMCGRTPALFASCLVAVSSVLVEYSTNGRGYTIVCCCFVVSLWIAELLLRRNDPALFLGLIITAVVGFYTIPVMLFPLGVVVVFMLISVWPRRSSYVRLFVGRLTKVLAAALVLILLCYLPVFTVSGWADVVTNQYVAGGLELAHFASDNMRELRTSWDLWNRDMPLWLSVALVIGFIVSLISPGAVSTKFRRLFIAAVLWCGCIMLLRRFAPFARVWLFLLPGYFACAIWGLGRVAVFCRVERFMSAQAYPVMAMALLSILTFRNFESQSILDSTQTGVFRDAEQIVRFLVDRQVPPMRVRATEAWSVLNYYFVLANRGTPTENTNTIWLVVNRRIAGETLDTAMDRHRLRGRRIVTSVEFKESSLHEILIE